MSVETEWGFAEGIRGYGAQVSLQTIYYLNEKLKYITK